MLRRRAGTSSSTPDFCQLRFRGVSSYGKLIPELASSHMVLIAFFFPFFFPADLLHQDSSTWARPGSTRKWEWEWGKKQIRKQGGKISCHTLMCVSSSILLQSPLVLLSLLSCLIFSSRLPSPPILSSPLSSCLFSSLSVFSTSCLPYSHLLSSSSYVLPFSALGYTQRLAFCLSSSLLLSHLLFSGLISCPLVSSRLVLSNLPSRTLPLITSLFSSTFLSSCLFFFSSRLLFFSLSSPRLKSLLSLFHCYNRLQGRNSCIIRVHCRIESVLLTTNSSKLAGLPGQRQEKGRQPSYFPFVFPKRQQKRK